VPSATTLYSRTTQNQLARQLQTNYWYRGFHQSPFRQGSEVLKKLSTALTDKWEKPCAVVRGYVNTRMSIAIVRATHICLRGSRIPTSTISNRRPQWEDTAGLSLFRNST
jgi:hypothetical protein